ncbi:hypothetical protein [Asticcacaulis sp.]|uniref:DUF6630 family protein n=1 Tax=Asticcacaulis sp. TaxID=1872648 RepID=UPI0031DE3CCC
MMSLENTPIIGIDWKFVGRDYLGFFPEHYPDLAFFKSDAFEYLRDELANELPETCFERLSVFLAEYGYELWNIDTLGDEYRLLVAPSGQGETVCRAALNGIAAEWDDAEDIPDFGFERLAPVAKPMKPGRKQTVKAKLPPIATQDDWHRSYGGVWRPDVRQVFLDFENEAGEDVSGLVDLHTFPLTEVDATGFYDLQAAGHSFMPLYGIEGGQYWEWQKPQKRQKIYDDYRSCVALISDYNTPIVTEIPGSERRHGDNLGFTGFGQVLFQKVRADEAATWHNASALRIGRKPETPEARASLLRFDGVQFQHIAELHAQAHLLPLDADTIAVFDAAIPDESGHTAAVSYYLIDSRTWVVMGKGQLPFAEPTTLEGLFVLGGDDILYVRTTQAAHPTHAALTEATGWLVRFNLRSGGWQQAKLEGLHDDYTINMALLRHQPPDKHRIRSFQGGLSIERGHDDWCILNYITSYAGRHDLAWLWNTVDDEIVRLLPEDFPRREPSVHWNPALGRYVADESCRLSLLPPFEELRQRRASHRLVWGNIEAPKTVTGWLAAGIRRLTGRRA